MKKTFLVFLLIFGGKFTHAQELPAKSAPIRLEVLGGHVATAFQMIVSKPMFEHKKFDFFYITSTEVPYESGKPIPVLNQSIVFYKPTKWLSGGLGGSYTAFGGFSPIAAVAFSHHRENFMILAQPTIELKKQGLRQFLGIFEWSPINENIIRPYFLVQIITEWSNVHSMTQHRWRLGTQYKDLRFGGALNFYHFGAEPVNEYNAGLFILLLIKS